MQNINKKNSIIFFVFCIYSGIIFALAPGYSNLNDKGFSIPGFLIGGTLTFIALFIFKQLTGVYHRKYDDEKDHLNISVKASFLIPFTGMTAAGIIWLIVFFPGVIDYDTTSIMVHGYGVAGQHPWLYCFVVQGLEKIIYGITGNMELFIAVYSILQILLCAVCTAGYLCWVKTKGINKYLWWVLFVLFICTPIIHNYTV